MQIDLPKQYTSWVDFWDAICDASGQECETVVVVDGRDVILDDDPIAGSEYRVRDIKDNALEELLQDRYTKKEALQLFARLRLMVYDQLSPTNGLGETLSRLKRIILTQAKNQ